jgi:hypothetical protein
MEALLAGEGARGPMEEVDPALLRLRKRAAANH